MPWVRLDENVIDHPKFLALSDGAWRLWCEGQTYCQKHLTDGRISAAALRRFRYYSAARVKNLTSVLVQGKGPCWNLFPNGDIQVHDYLEWNDSAADIIKARNEGKERRRRWSERNASGNASVDASKTPNVPSGVVCSTSRVGLEVEKKKDETDARSKRPVFKGSRFVVFEWQLDDLRKMLGSHFDAFDMHQWLSDLDVKVDRANVVVPQRDSGKWLYEQTLDEAIRRGLPVVTTSHGTGKTAGNAAAIARFIKRGESA